MRCRGRDCGRECLAVQAVHDQLLHAFSGIVEFVVVETCPDLALSHLLCDKLKEIANDLDLLVYCPLLLDEFLQERAEVASHRVGRAVSQLLEEFMEVEYGWMFWVG